MADHLPSKPTDPLTNLSPQAAARRDAMLPELLAEVRHIRRRQTIARIASVAGAFALLSGVLALALLRTTHAPGPAQAIATLPKSSANLTTRTTPFEQHAVRIEIVQSSPDILERLSLRGPSLVRVEYINTDQALALLESTGARYGIIEIAGRVEFQLIAQK